ncbi:MAG: argininosuccinate lyase, partial [Alphaproteobacteria bacterium]|nr:argininosuccinate lyase [Alphaproteobacteria bacterium]
FRVSHHITGRVVALAEDKGCGLEELALDDLRSIDARITGDVFDVLGVDNSVRSRTSYGGTAPDNVRSQIAAARERFLS